MAYVPITVAQGETITSQWGNDIQQQYAEVKIELAKASGSDIAIGASPLPEGSMVKIAEVTLGADGQITFSNIPQTYTHLRLILSAKSSYNAGPDYLHLHMNGDTTEGNYVYNLKEQLYNSDNGWYSAAWTSDARVGRILEGDASANAWAVNDILISDYVTTKLPVAISQFGFGDMAANGRMVTGIGTLGRGVSGAVTSLKFSCEYGTSKNLKSGSKAILYGIK